MPRQVSLATLKYAEKFDPRRATPMQRRAAEIYVSNGCRSLYQAMIAAGYKHTTARRPGQCHISHDLLLKIAAHVQKNKRYTASMLRKDAVKRLGSLMNSGVPSVAGAAAKTIIELANREEERGISEISEGGNEKWDAQIKKWKRIFLRRGIMLGLRGGDKAAYLLSVLDYQLGRTNIPPKEWLRREEQRLLGSKSDMEPGEDEGIEVLEVSAEYIEEDEHPDSYSDSASDFGSVQPRLPLLRVQTDGVFEQPELQHERAEESESDDSHPEGDADP